MLTDNRNRAAANVRTIFTKNGGNLGETGSVAFMFDRLGEIVYPASARRPRTQVHGGGHRGRRRRTSNATRTSHVIFTAFEDLGAVAEALEAALGSARSAQIVWKAKTDTPGRRRRRRRR